MQSYKLNLSKRETTKKARRAALGEDKVLANIYGGDGESVAAQGDYREIYKVVKAAGKNHPIKLLIGDEEVEVLVHDVEKDTLSQRLHHITFRAFKRGEKIKTEIPIHIEGEAPAVKLGMMLVQVTDVLNVEAIPSKLPESFNVFVDGLEEEGQDIRVEDLEVDEDVVILEPTDTLIVRVEVPRAQVEDEPEEEDEDEEAGEGEDESEDKEDESEEA